MVDVLVRCDLTIIAKCFNKQDGETPLQIATAAETPDVVDAIRNVGFHILQVQYVFLTLISLVMTTALVIFGHH